MVYLFKSGTVKIIRENHRKGIMLDTDKGCLSQIKLLSFLPPLKQNHLPLRLSLRAKFSLSLRAIMYEKSFRHLIQSQPSGITQSVKSRQRDIRVTLFNSFQNMHQARMVGPKQLCHHLGWLFPSLAQLALHT